MKRQDYDPSQLKTPDPFDKPPASSIGEAVQRLADRLGDSAEGLFSIGGVSIVHLIVALALLGALGVWLLVKQPFAVAPLTPADEAMLAAQRLWPVRFSEDFSDPALADEAPGWDEPDQAEYHDVYRFVENGHWVWDGDFSKNEPCCRSYSLWFFPEEDISDFWLSVDFTRLSGHEGASHGVLYHYQSLDNFYLADINNIGNGNIERYSDGDWKALFTPGPWAYGSIMYSGGANTFQISVEDGHVIIFVNGKYVGQKTDTRIPGGKLAIALPKPYDGGQFVLAMDNIQLRMK